MSTRQRHRCVDNDFDDTDVQHFFFLKIFAQTISSLKFEDVEDFRRGNIQVLHESSKFPR